MATARPSPRPWLLAIAVLCLAGVAAALAGQYLHDMRPCPWCILQRALFVAIAASCLVGAVLPRGGQKAMAGATVLFAAAGAAAALWQHFVAARSTSCARTFADRVISTLQLESLSPKVFGITGSCADGAVDLLGAPFEFWSLGLFAVVAGLAVSALRR